MTVALGDFDSHPIIPMIENINDTNKEESHVEEEDEEDADQTTKKESLFLVKNKTNTTKKILIQELS